MNLIALLIGLVVERLASQLFHWRRMRWLDRIIDFGFEQANRLAALTSRKAKKTNGVRKENQYE